MGLEHSPSSAENRESMPEHLAASQRRFAKNASLGRTTNSQRSQFPYHLDSGQNWRSRMRDSSEDLLSVAIEIRELLRLLAEPAIAQRDEKLRTSVREIAGRSQSKRRAIFQMDGTQSQKEISHAVGIDQGDLSKLVKADRK